MALHLVLHGPEGEDAPRIRAALRDAVWEVAESHWPIGEAALLIASDLSADYLLAHFRRALAHRGFEEPGLLLVAPLQERPAASGLSDAADVWIAQEL